MLKLPKVRPTRFTLLLFLVSVLMVGQAFAAITPPLAQNKYRRQVVLDSSGNAIVSGFNDGALAADWNYLIVKYNSAGTRLWSRSYNGPKNGVDEITAITVDRYKNIYVTGYSDGHRATDYDYATIKYDQNGNRKWVKRYNGPGNGADVPRAIVVDRWRNVYVTGYSDGGRATDYDYATIKYDEDGKKKWVSRYNGPADGADVPNAIGFDAKKRTVYVTGYSDGGRDHDNDYATIKYDSSGKQKWASRFDGEKNGDDQANAMVVDSSGNAFVTGKMDGGRSNDYDYMTIKYDDDGEEKWQSSYNGKGNGADVPTAIVRGGSNVYITGYVDDGRSADYNYATIKYDKKGKQKWVERFNGNANGSDRAYAIAIDSDRNTYVTGYSDNGPTTRYDFATIKYSDKGTRRWITRFNGPRNTDDRGQSVAQYKSKIIYVLGRSRGLLASQDYALVRMDAAAGKQDWVARYGR